jgi:hypothetical protein
MMPWLKWLPWRLVIRRIAHTHGFLDPVALLALLHRFSQPSEVAEPIELLRAGVIFHARGLINARVIQHNLDWSWPYWIERQFDPLDDAFIPRAFSITHVNLTHRNWTAVGVPDVDELPIVDPRGLLTPLYDGWSLDSWLFNDDGRCLLPSQAQQIGQYLDLNAGLAVITESAQNDLVILNRTSVQLNAQLAECTMHLNAYSDLGGWLVVALRPYNPEGISFIHQLELTADRSAWIINGQQSVRFNTSADRHHISNYHDGDVAVLLQDLSKADDQLEQIKRQCDVGMVTAAAMFRLHPHQSRELIVNIPLTNGDNSLNNDISWDNVLTGSCQLSVSDKKVQFLYDAAIRTLILHTGTDVYPGPYTYKRFWFRDATFIIHALLCLGLNDRAERALNNFPARQTVRGYFHSQDGEWDANGQVLWIMHRFCTMTNQKPKASWWQAIKRGGRWIGKKRLSGSSDLAHAGLLPAGFSAEHLGPNDYYYWDDLWSIAGLQMAASLCPSSDNILRQEFTAEANSLQRAVDQSLTRCAKRLGRNGMPAAPTRRLDAGAIGSLAMGYPLQLCPANDPRLIDTANFLHDNCLVQGGFFQDMIHSGINPYLTLHLAQVLLRAEDPRFQDLMKTVADLASPTGQWPEAIHPRTRGGCMGDGQHVWAAAEWVMMVRHCFVREEGDRLILCQGITNQWIKDNKVLNFGPAPTSFGTLTIKINTDISQIKVSWFASWHSPPSFIELRLPGFQPVVISPDQTMIILSKESR